MKSIPIFILLIFLTTSYNAQQFVHNAEMKKDYIQLSGKLFKDVQLSGVFRDSKTFVDAVPLKDPKLIIESYEKVKSEPDFDLMQFLNANFQIPQETAVQDSVKEKQNIREHITALWPKLTRTPDEKSKYSTLIPLENPYVVPGGRFREVYYWDTYFTMLGLLADKREKLAESILKNFASMLEQYGLIPNGNRIYYLTRSQPPFFAVMVDLLCRYKSNYQWGGQFLNALETEYRFWMNGAESINKDSSFSERVVRLNENGFLNRYYDFDTIPREESFREDYSLGIQTDSSERHRFYRNLRAAAESGWDFSSRWFADTLNLNTIRTTDILPVDLNCLLYFLEDRLSELYRIREDYPQSGLYRKKANIRAAVINKIFWDEDKGYYFDYDWSTGKRTEIYSLAGTYPLFFGLADEHRAELVMQNLKEKFLAPGGLRTTIYETGQQWDAPNGWAPLQWVAIMGLRQYGHNNLADEIKTRWLKLITAVYNRTGKMFEKYNVEDLSLYAGGGEYPLQDGFGWTNGVAAALLDDLDVKKQK